MGVPIRSDSNSAQVADESLDIDLMSGAGVVCPVGGAIFYKVLCGRPVAVARLEDVTLVPTSCQHSAKLTQDCYATTGSVPIRLMTLGLLWLGKCNMFPSRYNPDLRLTESLRPAMSCAASGGGYAE